MSLAHSQVLMNSSRDDKSAALSTVLESLE